MEKTSNDIIKLTALVYLQEALSAQEYEACPELIGIAKELGSSQEEITDVITAYLRGDKPERGKGATSTKNRLGVLKEK